MKKFEELDKRTVRIYTTTVLLRKFHADISNITEVCISVLIVLRREWSILTKWQIVLSLDLALAI